jgi:hypothetical protein
MDNTTDRGTPLRPIILGDLAHVCNDLSMLIGSAYRWVPEEEWNALADELRPHLRAAGELIRQRVAKYRELIDLHAEERLDETVYITLASLREELKGRRAGIRGNCEVPFPLNIDDLCNRPL